VSKGALETRVVVLPSRADFWMASLRRSLRPLRVCFEHDHVNIAGRLAVLEKKINQLNADNFLYWEKDQRTEVHKFAHARREEKLQPTKEELSHMMKRPGAKTGWLGSEFPEPPTEF
jgi:hypothetical protein